MAAIPLIPTGQYAPEELRTPDLWLRRQRTEDAEADYEAVMASREALRVWSDSTWPEDDFTLDQNLADLQGHIEDALAGRAYGFTIWDRAGRRVLGSVYLEPVAPFLDAYLHDDAVRAAIDGCDVRVEYWLRTDTPLELERQLVGALRAWLRDVWAFSRPCWGSRRGMTERRTLLESLGLSELAMLRAKAGDHVFHLHAEPLPERDSLAMRPVGSSDRPSP
jgi:hypothetical protein